MNPKVLVVEDEPSLLDTLEYSLQRQGYDVSTASDGHKALEIACEQTPGPGAPGRDAPRPGRL
ncbi:MAG: hypothetical protein R2851_02085 [Caldilineaceae bacterium]